MTCTGIYGSCGKALKQKKGVCGGNLCGTCIEEEDLVLNLASVRRVPSNHTFELVELAKFFYLRALFRIIIHRYRYSDDISLLMYQALHTLWSVMDKAGVAAWILSVDKYRPTKETMRELPDYRKIARMWWSFLPGNFPIKGKSLYFKRAVELVPREGYCEGCGYRALRCDCE
jgi:hypothetical protein